MGSLGSLDGTAQLLVSARSVCIGVGEVSGGGVASGSSVDGQSEMPGAISFGRSRAQM
jgi:hypothetical protein